jgi:hypothetical protein
MRHACVALFVSSTVFLVAGFTPHEGTQLLQPASAADPPPASTTVAAPNDELNKKRIEYRDAMRVVVDVCQSKYRAGSANIDGLLEAQVALSDAELKVASTKAERLAVLEASLESFKKLEEYEEMRLRFGTGRPDEMVKAKTGRIHCELRILEERHRVD